MSTPWSLAADLLEQEPTEDDLDRDIREAARRLDWPDAAARLVGCLLELRPHPSEVEAARRVAAWLPGLRPQGWEQAPSGAELVEAVLRAYRKGPWHPDPLSATGGY